MSAPQIERVDGVIVVGAGYAGLHATRAAEGRGVPVRVIDREPRHSFVTRLAAVAGGTAPLADGHAPLDALTERSEIGSVVQVDDGIVDLADGRRFEADAVVVTTGAEVSRPPIDGIELARGLRSSEDARALRSAIQGADSLVIVGGGATGVQLAGAAAHARPDLLVHVVDADDRLLPGLSPVVGAGAARILRGRGVRLHLGHDVERITARGVEADGSAIDGLVVWAGGFSTDAGRLGLPTDADGRVLVERDLRVSGSERTFAAGDIAAHVDARGEALPMSAQIAVRAGSVAGANAARVVRGNATEEVSLRQIGWVLELGGRRGLAQLGPVPLTVPMLDLIPPFLHDATDLKNLTEIGGLGALRFAPASIRALVPDLASGWMRGLVAPSGA